MHVDRLAVPGNGGGERAARAVHSPHRLIGSIRTRHNLLAPASATYYSPPRSNGLIGGRSFIIVQSLESVSGSRLLCPAVVIK